MERCVKSLDLSQKVFDNSFVVQSKATARSNYAKCMASVTKSTCS
jgi:hypothetical protein